ncbi:3-oxoacyl-[acyl-carrier protein] reductase [Granulibacter bethesdensis]|nr:3-oxoacyl-[acyl-carrier protein] reductase [Granulibacter bethesdensis]
MPDVYTPFYVDFAGTKEPVRDLGVSARKGFAGRTISISAIGRNPTDIPRTNGNWFIRGSHIRYYRYSE